MDAIGKFNVVKWVDIFFLVAAAIPGARTLQRPLYTHSPDHRSNEQLLRMVDLRAPFARALSRGSVVLIGDAVHALPPNKGQGVSQAIEDVFVPARVVEQGRVLERYAEVRKPRVEKLREEFVMQRKEEERGLWEQWFRVWAFLGFLKVASWWRWVSGRDPLAGFGYNPDEDEI